jgi:hypothetical protein
VIALSLVPMISALAGALVDERLRLGITLWRAACRAAGLTPRSLAVFTAELLPGAIIGALMGGLIVIAVSFGSAARARQSLAAHLGCTIAMPVGAWLCALPLPLPFMLVLEAIVTGAVAWLAHAMLRDSRSKYAFLRVPSALQRMAAGAVRGHAHRMKKAVGCGSRS